MTYRQFVKHYKEQILPYVKEYYEKDGRKDGPARREAFNDEMDNYHREGLITDKQAQTWSGLPDSLDA